MTHKQKRLVLDVADLTTRRSTTTTEIANMYDVNHKTEEWPRSIDDADTASEKLKGAISAQRLTELADAGVCPHFRIDGGAPMFHVPELKRWAGKHVLQRCEGQPLPLSMQVVHEYAPPDVNELPKPLRRLQGLRTVPLVAIESGVYFLIRDDAVVYVGQSVNVLSRISEHRRTDKDFDHAVYLLVAADELNPVERFFIKALQPEYNREAFLKSSITDGELYAAAEHCEALADEVGLKPFETSHAEFLEALS